MARASYVFLRDRLYHRCMALFAALMYGFPSRRIAVIGITGTKGKSTVCELVAHILFVHGDCPAVSSSLRNESSGATMPRCFAIQKTLAQGVCAGARHAVLEVTSQGVLQSRHRFIRFAAAACTNLAPEHIEAHGGFDRYRDAKLSFFSYAARNPRAIFFVNADDPHAGDFARVGAGHTVIRFRASDMPSRLPGDFNRYNVGAAAAICAAFGVPEETVRRAIASFPGVSGRMERVQDVPFGAIVDYAVTPESLRGVYEYAKREIRSAKSETAGRGGNLIGVFGCTGGGRDTWKRPVMGGVAGEMCDAVVLTDDDSYDEDTAGIMSAIEQGLLASKPGVWREGENYWKIIDRGAAIRKAVSIAGAGDMIVLSGKGGDRWFRMAHGKKVPWSDRDELRTAIAEWSGAVPPPANPIP